MKSLLFFFILSSALLHAQIIKDSILGKPKFVKEFVIFLNDSGPYTFMKGDDEYGHSIIKTPHNLRKSMRDTWFETYFCRYINNETYYDKNRNIIKETWYYKSGEIVDDYVYTFDHSNRLITEISKNKYSERKSKYWYEENSKTAAFKENSYQWKDEPARRYLNKTENYEPLIVTKFDTLTKTDSIFAVTNNIWKATGKGSFMRSADSVYHKRLSRVKIYDNEYRVIEENFFNYEDDLQNKIYSMGQFQYQYDASGNIIKKTLLKEGKPYSYSFFENGKLIKEEKAESSEYTVYTKNHKQERKTTYYKGEILHDQIIEYKGNYITGLFFLDKLGKEDQKKESQIIRFKYKFDKYKNWIEIIKNVDGKDLYKWVRKIEYY